MIHCLGNLLIFYSIFISETQQGIFDAVLKGHIDFDSEPWPIISDSAKDLIRKMLCSRPSERLTAHAVLCTFSFLFICLRLLFLPSNLDGYLQVGQPYGDWLSVLGMKYIRKSTKHCVTKL